MAGRKNLSGGLWAELCLAEGGSLSDGRAGTPGNGQPQRPGHDSVATFACMVADERPPTATAFESVDRGALTKAGK